ncbi:MAG: nitroreductase family protein [Prolixibacteraceae bacterium]
MELNKAIKNRWSPRSFSDKPVTDEMLNLLFEAARWAPSSRNAQPWNYYYARKGEKEFDDILTVLTGINPDWAKNAQVLMISVIKKKHDFNNQLNGKALHDMGAASALMAVQAAGLGMQIHQMGGFDKEKATTYLNLDTENFEPVTCIAIGFQGEARLLPEDLKKRELQPRIRKERKEFIFPLSKK